MTQITCNHVTFNYSEFANVPGNVVYERVKVNGVVVYKGFFTFNGSTGSNTISFSSPNGAVKIDANATWNTHGVVGNFDHHLVVTCKPSISIVKEQKIEGTAAPWTKEPLTGASGETVLYRMFVKNTGNQPIEITSFLDEKCDPGTLKEAGPSLAPNETIEFTCSHELMGESVYTNEASVEGKTPTEETVGSKSNEVVVYVSARPEFTIEKTQQIGESGFVKHLLLGEVGETVEYEITVKNVGTVPLTFGSLSDTGCEGISGGPVGPLQVGESAVYTCTHVLTETDKRLTYHENCASITATPPEGEGGPITHPSNCVQVNIGKKVGTEFTCKSVTFYFYGFPNGENEAQVRITASPPKKVLLETTLHWIGPEYITTITFEPPEGTTSIDANVKYAGGSIDHHWLCPPPTNNG